MFSALDETICGAATIASPAARGIVRLGGPRTGQCVAEHLLLGTATGAGAAAAAESAASQPNLAQWHAASRAAVTSTRAPRALAGHWACRSTTGFPVTIPVTVLLWPNDRSYIRQPLAEIHLPGSPPLTALVLSSLCQSGARLARPGEFTLRAFLAGRIDLPQAEAVLGVIDAPSLHALVGALEQLAGSLGTRMQGLRESLVDLLARLEVGLDFGDQDIAAMESAELLECLTQVTADLTGIHAHMTARGTTQQEPLVVLHGRPNVGKSSLYNALTGASALVSNASGTTRDYLTSTTEEQGVRFCLLDTAGVDGPPGHAHPARDASADAKAPEAAILERAQRTAWLRLDEADLILECHDAATWSPPPEREPSGPLEPGDRTLLVLTKADQLEGALPASPLPTEAILTSARTGQGLQSLRQTIAGRLAARAADDGRVVAATATRCRHSLQDASDALARAHALARHERADELIAAELRCALDAVGEVIGATVNEDVLDRIFSRFCIGK